MPPIQTMSAVLSGAMALLIASGARPATAQSIDLTGWTQTLDLDAAHPPSLTHGEPYSFLPGWGQPAPAVQPLSSPSMSVSLGSDPYSVEPVPGFPDAYISLGSGGSTVLPNLDSMQSLAKAGLPGFVPPVGLGDGLLKLVASRLPTVLIPLIHQANVDDAIAFGEDYNLSTPWYTPPLVSGAFNTYPFGQTYGYFEITARIPAVQGLQPWFSLQPMAMVQQSDYSADEGATLEFALMDGGNTSTVSGYVSTADGAWLQIFGGTLSDLGTWKLKSGVDLSQGLHRFGVDWEADNVTFYLDGVPWRSFPTPADLHGPMFLEGCLCAEDVNSLQQAPVPHRQFPATMEIQSIKVWQRPN